MKIEGKKYLNKNSYQRININLLGDEYKIRISSKDCFKTIESEKFTDEFKTLNDDKIVLEIVKHFLRNSNIIELHDKVYIPRLPGWYSLVRGSNNRELIIKLNNSELSREIIKLVRNKYIQDRYNYYINNEVYNIYESSNKTSYGDSLYLKTVKKGDNLVLEESERLFLKYLIMSKLNYEDDAHIKRILSRNEAFGYIDFGIYFVCGDLKIGVNSFAIHNELVKIIYEYNAELRKYNEENKQLRLEMRR